jgi:WS/DGAT/MGAT family acyltransferase
VTDVPRTSFNRVVGPRRTLAFSSVSLADVRRIKEHAGVTVNDVVLALCSTALRGYLAARGELPDAALVTGVPVSTRAEGDTAMDNQVATMQVSLATDVADPVERLAAIHESSRAAKAMTEAVRAHPIGSLGETAPPLVLGLAVRAAASTNLLGRLPTIVNTLVSNVPGPPFPLYTAGARVTGIFPTSVIMEGMGLNITVFSYEDRMDFGLHMDPELVDDGWGVAERIPGALAELLEAMDLGDPTPVRDPFGADPADGAAAPEPDVAEADGA